MSAAGTAACVLADDAPHLLVVDDDRRIRNLLSRYLGQQGFRITTAGDTGEAMGCLRRFEFDLLVLDVMMPGENGFAFAARLRGDPSVLARVPILMLTARTDAADRVRGLEAGVDDYLGKPFEPRELSLRIASILRRAHPRSEPPAGPATSAAVRFGDFTFDPQRGALSHGEAPVHLTERERDLLLMLAETPGAPVTRLALAGPSGAAGERTVDVQVNRLRRKIEADPAEPRHLQTVRGAGYRLVVDRP